MRDGYQRFGEHLVVRVVVDVSGKVAVDLQQIKEEILEVAKGGHPCPEIMESK